VVDAVLGNWVVLRDTVFYAFSGGQESDSGTIGGHTVLEARKKGRFIEYDLGSNHGLWSGQPVRVDIDWPRRYRLMRLHFAAELVLELMCRRLPAIEKIGAHIAADKSRVDFAWPHPLGEELAALSNDVRHIVDCDLPIISAYSDEAAQRRYWEVRDVARVPCGGTHLRRTGETGALALKRKNLGKNKERVEISLVDARE
jgi:Ser-tRNA(Ala) deacylase AlaX